MDEDMAEGNILHKFAGHEHHAGNPEENNIIARNEDARWEELLNIRSLIRPSHGRERPEGGAEPRIENVRVPMDVCAVSVRAFCQIGLARHLFAAVIAVPDLNLMAPPELPGNAPVMDIFEPVIIGLRETVRHKFRIPISNSF